MRVGFVQKKTKDNVCWQCIYIGWACIVPETCSHHSNMDTIVYLTHMIVYFTISIPYRNRIFLLYKNTIT